MNGKKTSKAARMMCLLAFLGLMVVAATGCDEYGAFGGYGAYPGSSGYSDGWYDYGFTTTDAYGNPGTGFSLNPYTDVGSSLDNYLSDSVIW